MNVVAIEEHPDPSPGYWWACQHPERRPDGFAAWYWECDPCMISMAAYVAMEPDGPGDTRCGETGALLSSEGAAQAFEDAKRYRAEIGLPPLPI